MIWIIKFVLYYFRFFARLALKKHHPKIIAITGSVGKSSSRNAVAAVLKNKVSYQVIEKGNSETGIPLGILGLDPGSYRIIDWLKNLLLSPFKTDFIRGCQYLIIEMGVDSPFWPKNMDYLLTIVQPDIAVVLNAYPVHTMQFDSLINSYIKGEKRREFLVKRIAKEKAKIISLGKPKIAIYNSENQFINEQLEKIRQSSKSTQFYSFKGVESDLRLVDYQLTSDGTEFSFYSKKDNQRLDLKMKRYFLPKEYEEVFSAAILVGQVLGLKNQEIITNLEDYFSLPAGRGSIFQGVNDSIIIDSSYNASKASMIAYLKLAANLAKKENRPLIFALGEMRELGLEAELEHQEVAEKIVAIRPKKVFLVGEAMLRYVYPILKEKEISVEKFENSVQLGKRLREVLDYKALVLFKGSQNTIFLEEAIKFILKNKQEEKSLCRQSRFWQEKKRYLFR